jgi:hypothetical protein
VRFLARFETCLGGRPDRGEEVDSRHETSNAKGPVGFAKLSAGPGRQPEGKKGDAAN